MFVSLSMNMVLCFKENLFIVAYIFLIVFEHRGQIAHFLWEIKKVNLFYSYPQTIINGTAEVVLHSCCKTYCVREIDCC